MTNTRSLLAFAFGCGLTLLPDLAAAQPYPTYRGERRYEDSYITRQPRRGYTGWGSGPLFGYYCDYQRVPIRRCFKGRCRVVAWDLRQYCY